MRRRDRIPRGEACLAGQSPLQPQGLISTFQAPASCALEPLENSLALALSAGHGAVGFCVVIVVLAAPDGMQGAAV